MRLFLASTYSKTYLSEEIKTSKYLLESFYYFDTWQIPLIKSSKSFLLDSGAFTFLQKGGNTVDWDSYIDKYIDFIKANDVDLFFELDIDAVVGYEKVKEMRRRMERKTQKQCIPVWHRSRGPDEYIRLCDEYPYIAIGGFAIKDIKPEEYKCIHKLLSVAASKNTKVHGLGFTPKNVMDYDFFSVDSSSWTSGSRFASIYQFTGNEIRTIKKPPNTRLINYKELDRHNIKQWIKYQSYLDGVKRKE